MSLMIHEKVEKSRIPFIVLTTLTVLTAIILSMLGKKLIISHTLEGILDVILFGVFVFLTWRMHRNSNKVRKYSIVGDTLYIHDILKADPVLINKIKLKDIESVKETKSLLDRIKGLMDGSYCINKDIYKVNYIENGEMKDCLIYMSKKMINRLDVESQMA